MSYPPIDRVVHRIVHTLRMKLWMKSGAHGEASALVDRTLRVEFGRDVSTADDVRRQRPAC